MRPASIDQDVPPIDPAMHVLVYGRGPHLGRYFYCPPPENVCQLTPRLVWTPAGYQRVFYPRLVW